ncbi:dual specificity protein phosphatase family protein [Phanerochaete sordida]|uniref:protein-tyrosine-phosphatase n=1 Tax=Phanerochaete sordida TaxID=48140 RepID=A0A9P3GMC2_9APHY|nr:dual specificity protein phosphatase family protein [Phanerochaete sordida]
MLSRSTPKLPSTGLAKRKAMAGLAAAHATASKAPSEILPRLLLSSYTIAADAAQLHALGVTHVVSVLEFPPEHAPGAFATLHVKLEDSFHTHILPHLDATTAFIRGALEENETNKVLVHCLMGVSRSATVVCAYLIATKGMSAPEAIDFVTQRRPIVSPNIGFRAQLEIYAEKYTIGGGKAPTSVKTRTMTTRFRWARRTSDASSTAPPKTTESKDAASSDA